MATQLKSQCLSNHKAEHGVSQKMRVLDIVTFQYVELLRQPQLLQLRHLHPYDHLRPRQFQINRHRRCPRPICVLFQTTKNVDVKWYGKQTIVGQSVQQQKV